MGIAECQLRHVGHPQSGLEPYLAAVNMHLVIVNWKPMVRPSGEKSAAAIIPGAKLAIAKAKEPFVRVRKFQFQKIVVIVEDRTAIDREQTLLLNRLFEMKILNPSKRPGGPPLLSLELRFIAIHEKIPE